MISYHNILNSLKLYDIVRTYHNAKSPKVASKGDKVVKVFVFVSIVGRVYDEVYNEVYDEVYGKSFSACVEDRATSSTS